MEENDKDSVKVMIVGSGEDAADLALHIHQLLKEHPPENADYELQRYWPVEVTTNPRLEAISRLRSEDFESFEKESPKYKRSFFGGKSKQAVPTESLPEHQ